MTRFVCSLERLYGERTCRDAAHRSRCGSLERIDVHENVGHGPVVRCPVRFSPAGRQIAVRGDLLDRIVFGFRLNARAS